MFLRAMKIISLLLCFCVFSSNVRAATLDTNAAREYIVTLAKHLDVILDSAHHRTKAQKAQDLRVLFKKNFAISQIAQFIVRRYWGQMTPSQKQAYQKEFETFVLYKYSYQIADLPIVGSYQVRDAMPVGNGSNVIVNTVVKDNRLSWRVARIAGHLQIVDIIVEDLSMVQSEQGSFGDIIDSQGVDGLIKLLHKKNQEFLV